MAGGFKKFGPTYKTTDIVRLGYEGYLNGAHPVSSAIVAAAMADPAVATTGEPNAELAGKIAAIKADGVGLAGVGGAGAVGLFREDLHDMVNASLNATFYFRGGEYFVQKERVAQTAASAGVKVFADATFTEGDKLTTDGLGRLVPVTAGFIDDGTGTSVAMPANPQVVGVCTHVGTYTAGNMYEWAGDAANGGIYIGFIMYV